MPRYILRSPDGEGQVTVEHIGNMRAARRIVVWLETPSPGWASAQLVREGNEDPTIEGVVSSLGRAAFLAYDEHQAELAAELAAEFTPEFQKSRDRRSFSEILADSDSPPSVEAVNWIVRELDHNWAAAAEDVAAWLDQQSVSSESPVTSVLRDRPRLFEELSEALVDNPVVFVVGGERSGIDPFLEGYRSFVDSKKAGFEVGAKFDLRHLEKVTEFLGQVGVLHEHLEDSFRGFNAILATLAFEACDALFGQVAEAQEGVTARGKASRESGWIPEAALDSPELFGFFYAYQAGYELEKRTDWRKGPSHALTHKSDCIEHFLSFLKAAVGPLAGEKKLTVFMPFDTLAKLLRDRRPEGMGDSRDYYQPAIELVTTLSRIKENQFPSFRRLGVLIRAGTIPPSFETYRKFLKRAVLVVPALTRSEIGEVVSTLYSLEAAPESVVEELERETAGEPWFLSLITAAIGEPTRRHWTPDLVKTEISAAVAKVRQVIQTSTILTRDDLFDDPLKAAVYSFLEFLKQRLRSGDLDTEVLTWWKDPSEFNRGRLNSQASLWVELGLGRLCPDDNYRPESLHALARYPLFSLGRASLLASDFAKALLPALSESDGA